MKFIKWLLHPVYLLIIVIAVAVYINRGVLFSHSAVAPAAHAAVNKGGAVVHSKTVVPAAAKTAPNSAKAMTSPPAAKAVSGAGKVAGGGASTGAPSGMPKKMAQEAPVTPGEASPSHAAVGASADGNSGAAHAGAAAAPVAAARGSTAKGGQAEKADAIWYQARRAVWNGHIAVAEKAYQRLIQLRPNSADAHGELGNVLLQAGRFKAAAAEYVIAAKRLVAEGHMAEAWRLADAVSTLDPAKGAALREALMKN